MKTFIALVIFLSGWLTSSTCMADENSSPITSGDKAFFEQIKKAILTDDIDSFATNVSYPIELYFGGERRLQTRSTRIRTKAELKKYKSAIFSESLKSAVRNQSADSMSKSWRGLMIANGLL